MAYERTSGLGFYSTFAGIRTHAACTGTRPRTVCVTTESAARARSGGCSRQTDVACGYRAADGTNRRGFIYCCPSDWTGRAPAEPDAPAAEVPVEDIAEETATEQTKIAREDWDADWIALDLEAVKTEARRLPPWALWGGVAAGVGLIGLLGWVVIGRK